jgi:hypothetical protein
MVKLMKHGTTIRMVCESDTGYVCNLEIYTDKVEKLEETNLPVLGCKKLLFSEVLHT